MNRTCSTCKYAEKTFDESPCKECHAHGGRPYWKDIGPERMSEDDYYLDIAAAVSRRSTCLRRQYGAVIVNNKEIIATGYNGPPRGEEHCIICKRVGHKHNDGDYLTCESVHAEMNAIISASRREMLGATLYLAGYEDGEKIEASPCPVCVRMIKNAGITKVVGTKV